MKNYKFFLGWQPWLPAAFLRREIPFVFLHRRQNAEVALHPACIVVVDIALNHADQLLSARKTPAVVTFAFQNAPESLHWSVVDTVRHTGHALRHACLFELVVEGSVRILETSVAVEQRMRVGISLYRLVEGLEYQRIVVALADDVGDDAPVIEIDDGAEVELVYLYALIPLELGDVGEPLLIWLVRVELAVEYILSNILWILRPPGTAMTVVLDGGLDTRGAADAQDALVVDMYIVVVPQLVVDPAISLVRAFRVDLLYLFGKYLILRGSGTQLIG